MKHAIYFLNQNYKEGLETRFMVMILQNLVSLEGVLYTRFEFIQDIIKDILNRKNELSQADIIRVIESMISMEQHGTAMVCS